MASAVKQCALCGDVLEARSTFTCSKCKRTPLCPRHRDSDLGICETCAAEERMRTVDGLQVTRRALNPLYRLSEFVFIICAAIYTAMRFIPHEVPDYIKHSFLADSLYLWGGTSACLTVILYITVKSLDISIRHISRKIFVMPTSTRGGYTR